MRVKRKPLNHEDTKDAKKYGERIGLHKTQTHPGAVVAQLDFRVWCVGVGWLYVFPNSVCNFV